MIRIWISVEPEKFQKIDSLLRRASFCKAYDLMVYRVRASYTPREGQEIAQNAARRAAAIRHNTRSVQEAIAACRHQCRAFSEIDRS